MMSGAESISQSSPVPRQGSRRQALGSNARTFLVASPATLFLLVLYVAPLLILFLQSFEGNAVATYHKALTDPVYVAVLRDTLLVAVYVSAICLVLGYPLAYFLANAPGAWPTIGLVFLLLPFWTSILVRTYGWMVLLGRNGIINRLLLDAGLIQQPLQLLNNMTGVLIGMVHVLLPYMVFPLYAAMRRLDGSLIAAAQMLGASGWQIFRRVYFPLTLPGVLAGVTLVYVLAIGFFITPALLGGGKVPLSSLLIEEQVSQFLNWGFAAALSVVLLAATLVVCLVLRRVFRGSMQWH